MVDSPKDFKRVMHIYFLNNADRIYFLLTWKYSRLGSSKDVSFWEPICKDGFVANAIMSL